MSGSCKEWFSNGFQGKNSRYLPVCSLDSWREKPLIPQCSLKTRGKISFRKKLEKTKKNLVETAKCLILLAGTTRLELATSGVTGSCYESYIFS